MAHFALLWKARTIEKHRQKYENEKINSIFMSHCELPDKTLFQKWKHYKHGMQKRLSRTFSKWYPEGSTVSNFFVNLRTDMKLPSILLRSFYGFLGGLCLTYLGFIFFVFQLSLSVNYATVLSSFLGVLVTLGLTFSNRMRCVVFLLVPQLFSRVGRYTLTCYALVLILTGPATNTLKNCEVLSTSMACTQERIKQSVRQINESVKKPHNFIKNSLKITITSMKAVVKKLKNTLIRINRLILSIAAIIESNFKWFSYVAEVYNKEIGLPHEKCVTIMRQIPFENLPTYQFHVPHKNQKKSTKEYLKDLLRAFGFKNVNSQTKHETQFDFGSNKNVFEKNKKNREKHFDQGGFTDANDEKLSTVVKEKQKNSEQPWFLDKTKLHGVVCEPLRSYEKFFVPADYAEMTYVATIREKLKTFVARIRDLLQVHLNIQHTYSFVGNTSSDGHVPCGVVTEIKSRADPILTWLSWSSCATSLFILLIIFRAKNYQRLFETRSRFDNRFITKEFRELDLKRLREGRETVLPLNTRERAKYVTTTSFRLVASEKFHLNRSAVFMTVATFKLLIHVVADYSLYWVLTTIRYHGELQAPIQLNVTDTGAFITGAGFVSRLIQAFVDTLKAELLVPLPDKACLPHPYPPDEKRYCQIGFLIFLLWFFALLEPYGLRMRHLIMGHYRPQRAKDRASWLYNHLLKARASFMKFARRKLHREYKYTTHSALTFRGLLQSFAVFRWLCAFLGLETHNVNRCLLCNVPEDKSDINKELIRCEVPKCPGNFCPPCFGDIGQLCTICLSPSDYGDFSDASLELGSSDDDDNDQDGRSGEITSKTKYERDPDNEGFQNDFYLVQEPNDEDMASSSRISNQKYYTLGRKEDNSDTTPLLKHHFSEYQQRNYYDTINLPEYHKDDITVKLRKLCLFLCETLKKTIQYKQVITNNLNKDFNPFPKSKFSVTIKTIFYSMYEITTNPLNIIRHEKSSEFCKYLRKNKLIRRKKYAFNNGTFWENISNITIYEKARKNAHKGDKAKHNKNHLNKSKKIKSNHIPNTEFDDLHKECAPYCVGTRKRRHKINIRNLCALHKRFYSALTNWWKNMKCTTLSLNCGKNPKVDEPPIKNNVIKRKKKRKKILQLSRSVSGVKLKKRGKLIGNSRLFAYLDERDWVKTFESDVDLQNVDEGVVVRKDSIIVNNITIPKLQLDLSNESINEQCMRTIFKSSAFDKFGGERKTYSKCAVGKFIKSIICNSCEFLLFEDKSQDDGGKDKEMTKIERNDVESFKDQNIVQKHDGNSSRMVKNITHPESHLMSATFSKQLSSTDDENQEFLIKRTFSNPLSIVKTIYSTLSFTRHDNKSKKHQLKREKTKELKHNNIIRDCNETKLNKLKQKQYHNYLQDNTEIISEKHIKSNPKETKSNSKTEKNKVENKSRKSTRAVLFIKEDQKVDKRKDDHVKKVTPKKIINKIDCKGIQTMPYLKNTQTDDKAVTVGPVMISCGCQNVCRKRKTEDLGVQVSARYQKPGIVKMSPGYDADSVTCKKTCSCAAQCYKNVRDAETSPSDCQKICNAAGILHSYKFRNEHQEDTLSPFSSIVSTKSSTSDTEDTKTDTTIYSLASVDYRLTRRNLINEPRKRYKVKVVTKSNQSTATDRAKHCDVSTATYDWWSPIIEKKLINKDEKKTVLDRKRKEYDMQKVEKKTFRNKGIMTGEKTVTFRSKTQFIPSRHYGFGDIMSPSRYLLESQKYYNELFYNILTSPRIYPIANIQKFHQDRERSQSNANRKRRKGHKNKRLEDSYTPRKNYQPSPWMTKLGPENLRKNKRV